jgi:Xaa-Pro dipeptidase
MRIEEPEFAARRDAFAAKLAERELAGAVLFEPQYVHYYSGFFFIPTERPIAFALAADGRGGMLVPRLEVEHAEANTAVQEISHYDEYPGERHPMEALRDLLDALGIRERLGADHDGYPWMFGYRGPSLGEWMHVADLVEDQMAIKSPAEIELLRESCKWANLAHTLLQRYTRPGVTETEVETRASNEATHAMLDAIGPVYRAQSPYYDGAMAGYRGQIGRNAAIPHAHGNNLVFQSGDVLVTGASAPVWGYHSELERTMVIGPPSDEQRRMFEHMVALQDIAFDAIRPGARCAEVDLAVRAYYEQHDL